MPKFTSIGLILDLGKWMVVLITEKATTIVPEPKGFKYRSIKNEMIKAP